LAAAAALAVGVTCAAPYARLMVPFYAAVARLMALGHPWEIVVVGVRTGQHGPGAELYLEGTVRRTGGDSVPRARLITHVQVGEVVESPVVFFTLLLVLPVSSTRRRLVNLAVGLPVFFVLEAITTAAQLMHSMAEASAILAGQQDPLTLWERWSRFLEAGGRFVVEICAAFLTIALARRTTSSKHMHLGVTNRSRVFRSNPAELQSGVSSATCHGEINLLPCGAKRNASP
jgi:hypothetical protein